MRDGHVLQSLPALVAVYATGARDRPLWLRMLALVAPVWMLGAAVTGYWPATVDDLLYVSWSWSSLRCARSSCGTAG